MKKPSALPEKEWFTLQEIAARWDTDVHTLIHYGHHGLLEIRTYWPTGGQPSLAMADTRPISVLPPHYLGNLERNKGSYPIWERDLQLPPLSTEGLDDETIARLEDLLPSDELLMKQRTTGNSASKKEELPVATITVDDLFIMREERDRFEQEHRVGAFAGVLPDPNKAKELDPRIKDTYLRMIRVMSTALKLPERHYKAAEILEIYAIEQRVKWPVKSETIANKLKQAYDLED
jgi:hypothetical protein